MGLGLAEPGFETACWVEIEEAAQDAIISGQRAGYFGPAPVWDNLFTFDGTGWRDEIDIVLAGYPCQPFSAAGDRKGEEDERHLWPDVARIVGEVRPRWLLLENVKGHLSLGLETVLRDIRGMGFKAAAGIFSSEEVGGAHERERVFIVAHSARAIQREERSEPQQSELGRAMLGGRGGAGLQAMANLRDGQLQEPGRRSQGGDGPGSAGARSMGDGGDEGLSCAERQALFREGRRREGRTASQSGSASLPIAPPGPTDANAWVDILEHAPHLAPAISWRDIRLAADSYPAPSPFGDDSSAESHLRRMAHGLASRARALRLLGNGVHPLAAAHAWRTLSHALGLRPVDLGSELAGDRLRTNLDVSQ